jgi:hypothetical protein
MHSDLEFWSLILTVAAGVVPWAFSIHAKVAVIANSVDTLPKMFEDLKAMLTRHEARLDAHDEEIAAIKKASGSGH